MPLKQASLSLGSNLGERESNLRRAAALLDAHGVTFRRVSSLYETEPQDVREQPWFLNVAVVVETRLFPLQLLDRIHKVQAAIGGRHKAPKGPRIIDIDILLYGNAVVETPRLVIPHPRMAARRFVLEPLAEIAPSLRHPVLRRSIAELLAATRDQQVRKLHPW